MILNSSFSREHAFDLHTPVIKQLQSNQSRSLNLKFCIVKITIQKLTIDGLEAAICSFFLIVRSLAGNSCSDLHALRTILIRTFDILTSRAQQKKQVRDPDCLQAGTSKGSGGDMYS